MNNAQTTSERQWNMVTPGPGADQRFRLPMTMEQPSGEAAEEVSRIGTEGAPADAQAGPGMLLGEILASILIVLLLATGMTIWLGWAAGVAVLAICMVALALNPVVAATWSRMAVRQKVINEHHDTVDAKTDDQMYPHDKPPPLL